MAQGYKVRHGYVGHPRTHLAVAQGMGLRHYYYITRGVGSEACPTSMCAHPGRPRPKLAVAQGLGLCATANLLVVARLFLEHHG